MSVWNSLAFGTFKINEDHALKQKVPLFKMKYKTVGRNSSENCEAF